MWPEAEIAREVAEALAGAGLIGDDQARIREASRIIRKRLLASRDRPGPRPDGTPGDVRPPAGPVQTRTRCGGVATHADLAAAFGEAEARRDTDDPVWKISFDFGEVRVRLVWEDCRWVWRPLLEDVAEGIEEQGYPELAEAIRNHGRRRNDAGAKFERTFGPDGLDWRMALFRILDAVADAEGKGVIFEGHWVRAGLAPAHRDRILAEYDSYVERQKQEPPS
jgi:hypothetical protein